MPPDTSRPLPTPRLPATPRSSHFLRANRLRLSVGLLGEVAEAVGTHDVGDGQAGGVEGVLQRPGRVGILNVGTDDSRVDEGHDAAEGLRGGQGGIRADGRDVLREGVEVLLGGNELRGRGQDGRVVTELGDDLVGELQLQVNVGQH